VAIVFLVAAVAADLGGGHELAFYLLLGSVVVTAHAALEAYGRLVELPGNAPTLAAARLQAVLGLSALALVVVAAAVRAPVLGEGVPAVGLSALVASLALLATQGFVRIATR
jgi:ABC-type proline/glycine betaine transport system permease subunit